MRPGDAWQKVRVRSGSRKAERTPSGRGVPRPGPVKRITAYVPVGHWREFRLRCMADERTMSDVVAELVAGWLATSER